MSALIRLRAWPALAMLAVALIACIALAASRASARPTAPMGTVDGSGDYHQAIARERDQQTGGDPVSSGASVSAPSTPGTLQEPPTAPQLPCTGWSLVASPNSLGEGSSFLEGAAAVSANDVWAVGLHCTTPDCAPNSIGGEQTLAEHWNGSAWSIVPGPEVGTGGKLFAVSAVSANDVWAVGRYCPTGDCQAVRRALIEHWNGTTWSLVTAADTGPGGSALLGVSALGANDVWAAGFRQDNGTYNTLVEHYNGRAWSIVPSPNSGSFDNRLEDIDALSASDVWVAGDTCLASVCVYQDTLIEHWNGSAWSIVPSPNSIEPYNLLNSVSAKSRDDVWAAGGYCSKDDVCRSLLEHWDGAAWALVEGPQPRANNFLRSILAVGPDDVWAAGLSCGEDEEGFCSVNYNLMQHWNGSSWSTYTIDSMGAVSNEIHALAAVGRNDLWAVGYMRDGTPAKAQAQHYTGPCKPCSSCHLFLADANPQRDADLMVRWSTVICPLWP